MAKRNYGYDDQVKADSGKKAKGKPPATPKAKKPAKPAKDWKPYDADVISSPDEGDEQ